MRSKGVLALALGLTLMGQSSVLVWSARKYYPPGFKPPTDQKLIPSATPVETPVKTQVIIQPIPGSKQVIIKTVPITVEKIVPVQAKPRDPLMVLMDEHRNFDALRLVDDRLKKSPNNLTLQLIRAKVLREQGNYSKSLDQYSAIMLDKTRSKSARAEAQNGMGWTYYQKSVHESQMGNHGAASASLRAADMAFRQAAHLAPDRPYAWAGLGEVALANSQVQDAEIWIKKAKKLGPNDLAVQLADANLMLAQSKPDEALQVLYGIKKTTTREPDVYLLLARASLETGKVDDAIINLKQLLELQPDHTEALKLLSLSYERKMKPEDAGVALEKAISLNPMDEKSVDALLKIYEQRREDDRGILVLKTLLKDHPGQAAYGLALLQRLANAERWDEVYEEGSVIIQETLVDQSETVLSQLDQATAQQIRLQKEGIVSLFARSVYQEGRGLLDRRDLLAQLAVQQAQAFAQTNLDRESKVFGPYSGQSLSDRLSLLLMDPLRSMPLLPATLRPSADDLPIAIQIAFLQGDHIRHNQWVMQAKALSNALTLANTLYELDDYQGATFLVNHYLAQHSDDKNALDLKQRIAADQSALQEHLNIIGMLPRRIPEDYWRKTASEVLELGSTDGKAHGVLGMALAKRHQPELALIQLRLAAKYAENPQDRENWTRRADKAARNIARNNAANIKSK